MRANLGETTSRLRAYLLNQENLALSESYRGNA